MKLLNFRDQGPRAGVLIGSAILDINSARPSIPPRTIEILRRGLLPEVRNLADNASDLGKEHFRPAGSAELYPPVLEPGKIICLGLNYEDHAREQDRKPPVRPMLFAKAPTALSGPFDDIVIPEGVVEVDAEAELAVVIGREGKRIRPDNAADYIAGFMAFNDVSARKDQREDRQWFRAKSCDTFAPCGPWLVTPDELGGHRPLSIVQRLNGEIVQQSDTSRMIFDIGEIITFISERITLLPGDIISTGTPAGVGVYRDPPVFLKDGDVVEIEIENVGRIRNRVRSRQA